MKSRLPVWLLVLALTLSLLSGCSTPAAKPLPPLAESGRWTKELRAFEQADATNPPPRRPIVFTGSSSIRLWADLATDFPDHPVMNRGFGGSQLSDVNEHFERLILQYRPRQVVIYCGGNDLNAGKSPETVAADLRTLHARLRRELPRTEFVYLSVALNPARWEQRDKVRAVNRLAAEFLADDPRSHYVEVNDVMIGPDGLPRPDIFVADRLHMNRRGYELWAPLVRPLLAR